MPSKKMFINVVMVTVAMAEKWLSPKVYMQTRKLRPRQVEKYARLMTTGRWKVTPQAIAFDVNGRLMDGQHRLKALLKSNLNGIEMSVIRNAPVGALAALDQGGPRSVKDVGDTIGRELGTTDIAVARAMITGDSDKYIVADVQEILDFMEHHDGAVQYGAAVLRPNRPGLSQAAVGAVFARAFYNADVEDLDRAAHLLKEGIPPDGKIRFGDKSILTLRDTIKNGAKLYGHSARLDKYRKVERALWAFLQREDLTKVYKARQEYFPLPEESAPLTVNTA